jgi:hypothetical protein
VTVDALDCLFLILVVSGVVGDVLSFVKDGEDGGETT